MQMCNRNRSEGFGMISIEVYIVLVVVGFVLAPFLIRWMSR